MTTRSDAAARPGRPLKVGLNTLGRSSDNDVIIAEEFVSRRHCTILIHLHDGKDEVVRLV